MIRRSKPKAVEKSDAVAFLKSQLHSYSPAHLPCGRAPRFIAKWLVGLRDEGVEEWWHVTIELSKNGTRRLY